MSSGDAASFAQAARRRAAQAAEAARRHKEALLKRTGVTASMEAQGWQIYSAMLVAVTLHVIDPVAEGLNFMTTWIAISVTITQVIYSLFESHPSRAHSKRGCIRIACSCPSPSIDQHLAGVQPRLGVEKVRLSSPRDDHRRVPRPRHHVHGGPAGPGAVAGSALDRQDLHVCLLRPVGVRPQSHRQHALRQVLVCVTIYSELASLNTGSRSSLARSPPHVPLVDS